MNLDPVLEDAYVTTVVEWPADLDHGRLDPDDCADNRNAAILRLAYQLVDEKRVTGWPAIKTAAEAGEDASALKSRCDALRLESERLADVRPGLERLRVLAVRRRGSELAMRAAIEIGDGRTAEGRAMLEQSITESIDKTATIGSAYDHSAHTLTELLRETVGSRPPVEFAMPFFATAIGPLRGGNLLTLGGTTGSGKSSLILSWLLGWSRQGHRCGVVSIEDGADVWGSRVLAHQTGVDALKILTRKMTPPEIKQAFDGLEGTKELKIDIALGCGASIDEVISLAQSLLDAKSCTVLVMDYLQAIRVQDAKRYDKAVSDCAKRLKGLCARKGVPLVLVSQVSRGQQGQEGKELGMWRLKESGDIENESECVVMIWHDDGITRGKIAKLKWGPSGQRFVLTRSAGNILDAEADLRPPAKGAAYRD